MVGGEGWDGKGRGDVWHGTGMSGILPDVEEIAGFLVSCGALAQFPGHLCP